jgi:hypothetical protein
MSETLFGKDRKPHSGDPLACAMPPDFDGDTFDRERDGKRLLTQQQAVESLMRDGKARTIPEIVAGIKRYYGVTATESGVSARIRDLRKTKFGGYRVDSTYRAAGVWEYKIIMEDRK